MKNQTQHFRLVVAFALLGSSDAFSNQMMGKVLGANFSTPMEWTHSGWNNTYLIKNRFYNHNGVEQAWYEQIEWSASGGPHLKKTFLTPFSGPSMAIQQDTTSDNYRRWQEPIMASNGNYGVTLIDEVASCIDHALKGQVSSNQLTVIEELEALQFPPLFTSLHGADGISMRIKGASANGQYLIAAISKCPVGHRSVLFNAINGQVISELTEPTETSCRFNSPSGSISNDGLFTGKIQPVVNGEWQSMRGYIARTMSEIYHFPNASYQFIESEITDISDDGRYAVGFGKRINGSSPSYHGFLLQKSGREIHQWIVHLLPGATNSSGQELHCRPSFVNNGARNIVSYCNNATNNDDPAGNNFRFYFTRSNSPSGSPTYTAERVNAAFVDQWSGHNLANANMRFTGVQDLNNNGDLIISANFTYPGTNSNLQRAIWVKKLTNDGDD